MSMDVDQVEMAFGRLRAVRRILSNIEEDLDSFRADNELSKTQVKELCEIQAMVEVVVTGMKWQIDFYNDGAEEEH